MKTSLISASCGLLVLCSIAPSSALASRPLQQSSTKDATKKTGSATKKEPKKVVNKSAEKTDEGAKKVEDKTQPK